jgi:hypothetical protein
MNVTLLQGLLAITEAADIYRVYSDEETIKIIKLLVVIVLGTLASIVKQYGTVHTPPIRVVISKALTSGMSGVILLSIAGYFGTPQIIEIQIAAGILAGLLGAEKVITPIGIALKTVILNLAKTKEGSADGSN